MRDAVRHRRGFLWEKIRRQAVIAGYAWERAHERLRDFRTDGASSFEAMLLTLMYSSDIRTGFVGKPRKGGGPWERYKLEDLAFFAFGSKDKSSVRKARRAMCVIINLGLAVPTTVVNRFDKELHVVRGEPAVRRLNWDVLAKLTNAQWHYREALEHANAKAAADRAKTRDRARSKANAIAALTSSEAFADSMGAAAERMLQRQEELQQQIALLPASTGDPPSN